jgi:putative DNA-invertase from lambdoid prophage Rac
MSRVFAYARVSTVDQHPVNQLEEIQKAGFAIQPRRCVEEKISGSIPAMQRPGFIKLMDKLEDGDTLIVTKLDRIGRDSIDVQQTVQTCKERGIRLHVLQLGALDLTSSTGEMTVKVLAAVADFERDLIIERTQAGQARARAEGKRFGRPPKTNEADRREIMRRLIQGETVTAVAKAFGVSRGTVVSIRSASPYQSVAAFGG